MAMGLRSPFRMSVDPGTGDLFIGDVGQSAIEEVDRIASNTSGIVNLGWANREDLNPTIAARQRVASPYR